MRPVLGFCVVSLFAAGCASVPRQIVNRPASPAQAVVFAADGIGNFGATSDSLRQLVGEMGLPLHVEMVEWSHGYGRMLADHVGYSHARAEGRKLAAQILCYQQTQGQGPPLPVYLVAHSGGSAVVLAAAELLPPDSVERIVLLAPSVSAEYDLRPALRSARQGVDVFHSRRDLGYLGLGVATLGTGDRRWSAAAGRVGFRPPASDSGDALYLRLHQYPWDPSVAWTGNDGGHFGTHRDRFLRAYVMPLLLPPARLKRQFRLFFRCRAVADRVA